MREAVRGQEAAIPALAAVGIFIALGASEGGYPARTWYPAALFLLALLVVALVAVPARKRVPRAVWIALALFGAYTAWAFLSIAWADQRGDAWQGANRTLLYLCVLALFALWPMSGRVAAVILGAFGLGIAVLGLVELLRLSAAADPDAFLVGGGRFGEPVGYVNANAALWFLAFLPCLFLSSRREVRPILRGLLLGGAVLLVGVCLMAQSRGWLITFPVALTALVALVPGRVRLLVALAAVSAGAAVIANPALDVLEHYEADQGVNAAVDEAAHAILLTSALAVVVGWLAAHGDLRFPLSPPQGRMAGIVAAVVVAALATGGLSVFVAREGSPFARGSEAWAEFKRGYVDEGEESTESSRLTRPLGTNRYDFWTVAWREFREKPLTGIGVENFQEDYLRRGDSIEQPRYPHSLLLGLLAQTGLIGTALLLGGLGAAAYTALQAIRRASVPAAAAAGAGTATFVYWAAHGSGEWFWEFPALGGPAMALLGMAAALCPRAPRRGAMAGRVRPFLDEGRWILVASGVALISALSLAAPWLAIREVDRAKDVWSSRPAEAFARLDRAAALNPLSSDPYTFEGAIALRLGELDRAERAFRAAIDRQPGLTFPYTQLAIVASQRGRREEALAMARRARELSPRDGILAGVYRDVRGGRRLDAVEIERAYLKLSRRRAE